MTTKPTRRIAVIRGGHVVATYASREAYEQHEREKLDARVALATERLLEGSLTRDQLAAACARAEVQGADLLRQLQDSRQWFGTFFDDLRAATRAIEETGDPSVAREIIGRTATFNFDKLIKLAEGAAVATTARKAAIARHSRGGPMAEAKAIVYECWQAWNRTQSQYASGSAFARAMLDKFPDVLTSQPVIERWVRDWRRKAV